ncbi:DUF6350 family protein [Salinibacterium sp. ZJ450]|uniref:cell division protein PerM n=1 Tax=Salinibacterium sp. ZJ450 TaxID=2708338 RepID=UPI001421C174|nr:DUF6350 family protein [Salinibacterium sp. ZJ450]
MNRRVTALLAAFESALVVAIGIAIPLVPLTVLWGFHFQLGLDWVVFWRAAVDIWLLGHGVDITMQLDPALAAVLALPEAGTPFVLGIAALGFALLTVLLALRTGRRVAQTSNRMLGEVVALATFAALAWAVTLSVEYPYASPSLWQGTLLPTVVFALGLLIGSTRERLDNPAENHGSSLRDWINDWPSDVRATVAAVFRASTAAVAAILAVAGLATAASLVLNYAEIIRLYESVQAGALGGAVLTLGQLAFLPNFVAWTASWLVGPGFAIGTGSSVGPLGTSLGPLPAVPAFGAMPTGDLPWGMLVLIIPVLIGFLAGLLLRRSTAELDWPWRIAAGVGTGVVAGTLLGLVAWAAAGSAGPGRLVTVGSDPWAVAVWFGVEIAVAATLGALSASVDFSKLRDKAAVG